MQLLGVDHGLKVGVGSSEVLADPAQKVPVFLPFLLGIQGWCKNMQCLSETVPVILE